MMNNGVSVVEHHNMLFERIRKANTLDDMRQLFAEVKEFVSLYEEVDNDATNRVFVRYAGKLQDMIDENKIIYNRFSEKAENIRNREYDFADEKDDISAVQNKVLQLMAKLPKAKTNATASAITNTIEQAIKSGTIGCKAVLELMKYPAYTDMIGENQKRSAFIGSQSEVQKAFERLKEKELREVEKSRADVFMTGFHLRNLAKQVKNLSKTSVWA